MAPRRSVRSVSGMTRSESICCSTPSPPHFGQAPNGLLNENSRGSISGMVKPETGQANFSENTRRLASDAAAVASLVVFFSPSPGGGGSDRCKRSGVGVVRSRRDGAPPPDPHPDPPPQGGRERGRRQARQPRARRPILAPAPANP